MTSPTDRRQAGFTLIEILVVLVILGLAAGLVLARGPSRSVTVDLRAQAAEIAQAMRGARGRAIAGNRPSVIDLDVAGGRFSVDGETPRVVRAPMRMAADVDTIAFAPDGSASGGTITLAEGEARMRIAVDWLTGRVSVGDAR